MVILRRCTLLILLLAVVLPALEREPWEVFQQRRRQVAEKHSDGVTILFGYGEEEGLATRSAFRQENNFYYLTGCNEPGAALLLLPQDSERPYREILFLPRRNTARERWTGPRIGPSDDDARAQTGFMQVRESDRLAESLREGLQDDRRLYALLPQAPSHGHLPEPDSVARLKKIVPEMTPADLRSALRGLRLIKSAGEIRLIQKAVDATVAGHEAAWRNIQAGAFEYQVMSRMLGEIFNRGCLRAAYPPIVASGVNSTILHYSSNASPLRENEVILMDVGGEYANYAADITRTLPVSGRFTQRQREVYNAVLGAQKAALQAVKPGMRFGGRGPTSLTQIAKDYLDTHGKDLQGNPLGSYLPHLIGHQVGLEVHDPDTAGAELQPGMVITIEPGVYLPEEGFGIRIEDMVLVTEQGSRLLSGDLPREIADIEERMRTAR